MKNRIFDAAPAQTGGLHDAHRPAGLSDAHRPTGLSDAQYAAVCHQNGPALVLAGPGSGKTTVIIARAVRIACSLKSPDRLLCVTFTKNAGAEMGQRYLQAFSAPPAKHERPVFRTLHSFCNRLLLDEERKTGRHYTRIEGSADRRSLLLGQLYRQLNGEEADSATLQRLSGWISRQAHADADPERTGKCLFEAQIRNFDNIYHSYCRIKAENAYLDFDDMIFLARDILRRRTEVRDFWNGRFDYIQVDEGQDLSRAQFEILYLIGRHTNLFVVADDDQSIYRFRGAEPACVFEFVDTFPSCMTYHLEENHRSDGFVVKTAAALISHNQKRFEKRIYTKHGNGSPVLIRHFRTGREQARFTAETAMRFAAGGGSVGILYRNHLSAPLIRLMLQQAGVPYAVNGSAADPGETELVREVLRKIRQAELDCHSFFVPKPVQTYRRLLRDGFLSQCRAHCERTGKQPHAINGILEFIAYLCICSESFAMCLQKLGQLGSDAAAESSQKKDTRITLSTIHSAKGLEYDCVLLVDLVQGEFPGSSAAEDQLLEEERRLFYVAVTRARHALYLLYPETRGDCDEQESMFLKECRQ